MLLVTVFDAAHIPTLSFYCLLAAVPAIVVAGLASVEELLESDPPPYRRAIAILHVPALLLVLLAAALRAPMRAEGTVPRAAVSAVIACLLVFAVQFVIAALPAFRRTVTPAAEPREVPSS